MVRKGTYTISFDVASNNPSVEGGLLLHNIQLEHGDTETDFEPYQDGGTVHIDSTTEFPLLGLKSFNGITNIISPGNVKCVYPTNESGKGVLDSLYNKDKMLTEQNKNLEVLGKCKNLLNLTLQTTTQNGVTCTNNGDGTYTLNGTATDQTTYIFANADATLATFKGHSSLKLVGFPKKYASAGVLQVWRQSDNLIMRDRGDGVIITGSNMPYGNCNMAFVIYKGAVTDGMIIKPMLTTDLNATYNDFVPYTGDGDTLTHDVAELKNDLNNNHKIISKTYDFGGDKKSYTIKNLTTGSQEFIITSIFRNTGVACECDGNIVIHKETTNGIKVINTFGASEVSVTYDSALNEINITTTKGFMTFIIQSDKDYIME